MTVVTAVFCYLAGSLFAGISPVYREGYQFDLSARTFGLLTTIRMEAVNGITGEKDTAEFVVVDSRQMDGKEKASTAQMDENGDGSAQTDENSGSAAEADPQVPVYGRNEMEIDFNGLASAESDTALKNLSVYLASQQGTLQNEYTGLFKGKNLILICAEAFSPYAVNEELMPTLYRLIHNGFYFSDYYQPAWGGSTSTGEFSELMGMIPAEGVKSIRRTEGHNLYLTIGNQLSRLGYFSEAYHNNSYTYYGRNKTHTNFGYSSFLGMGNGMEEGVENCWPQSDLEMMDFTVPRYIDKQPFSVYYMTVSGHCGYSQTGNAMSRKNWEAVSRLNFSDTVKAYYASQLELEYGMRSLVSRLEKAGILEDTVICMTSDHYPYGLEAGDTWGNSRNYLPELYGCEESELNKFTRDRNGLIIWSGCLETYLKHMAKEISEPVYSLDILPTLSNLFGVEYDSRLLVGRDVFSDAFPLVIWPDYSWKTDQAVYDAAGGRVTAEAGAQVSEEYVQNVKDLVKNKFNLSKVTLNYDYWDKVFGEETHSVFEVGSE
ncbi:MAG: LTA synthase family protein [Lachnospiraceae bacterium]|nr:LTA synthase family protein [Lachnospiraceae bacterium]